MEKIEITGNDIELPYPTPEQLMQAAVLLWKIIELGDQLEHPVPLEVRERLLQVMEQIRVELERLNGSLRIVNADLQRMLEKLNALIRRHRAEPVVPI